MNRGLIAAVLVIIISLTLLPSNAGAAISAASELYRSSVFIFDDKCFAIKADNSLWGWGYTGGYGARTGRIVAESTQSYFTTPVKVANDVLSVGCNVSCTFILKTNGELWGWGNNDGGGLAQSRNTSSVKKPIKLMEDVIDFKTGYSYNTNYTVALKKDGTLWHWGEKRGQSGDYWDSHTPSLLLENVAALCNTEYAIKKDGTMWELTPHISDYSSPYTHPAKIELPPEVQNAKILYSNAYIKTDGSLWRWGSNKYGEVSEVGAGHSLWTKGVPIENAKKKLDDVVFYDWSLAIKKDGSLWSWGTNEYGAMGKGDVSGEFYTTSGWSAGGANYKGTPYYTTPVKIMEDVAFCATGGWNGLAVKKDGSLWSWGNAYNGKVGNGSLRSGVEKEAKGQEFYPTPQKIMDGVRTTNATVNIPPPKYSAAPASAAVLVNGKSVGFEAYNIGGNNFFKLRDLAYALNGTEKQFAVGWDAANNAISLTTRMAYMGAGGVSAGKVGLPKTAIPSSSKIFVDGKEIHLVAYTIENSNYFKLRDIGEAIDFNVTWDGSKNSILINTDGSH